MKKCYILLVLWSCYSCNDKQASTVVDKNVVSIDTTTIVQQEKATDLTIPTEQPTKPQKPIYYRYISAPSGLNFRDAPQGRILGKFPFNTYIGIIQQTGVYDTIQDAGKQITGEWLEVRTYKEPVYVFDAFVSETYTEFSPPVSDIVVYPVMSYDKENSVFISLGDARMGNYEDQNAKTLNLNFTRENEWAHLSKKDRRDYLKFLKLNEHDLVHVYDYYNNEHYRFKINELPLIAVASPYDPSDYFVGLDFKGKFNCEEDCYQKFVYIGDESPFSNEGVVPVIWKTVSLGNLKKPRLHYNHFHMDDYVINEARTFDLKGYQYQYLDVTFSDVKENQRYVLIKNSKGETMQQFQLTSSEGHDPSYFMNEGDEFVNPPDQFAGQLFKNKPQSYFGFFHIYYDCDEINFVDKSIPAVRIACDNRH